MRQLDLELPPKYRWGGRRPNAGRKRSKDSGLPHVPRAKFARSHPCHVTMKVRAGLPSLRQKRVVREIERTWRAGAERGEFRLVHYSVQSNHVHLIVEATGPAALGRGMMSLGARFARAVNRALGRRGPVVADRFHSRALKTPREVRNALAYVLLNRRRHLGRRAGAVDPASSGRWFDGWRGRLGAALDERVPAAAHTWLLRVGWRRRGLLSFGEASAAAPG